MRANEISEIVRAVYGTMKKKEKDSRAAVKENEKTDVTKKKKKVVKRDSRPI